MPASYHGSAPVYAPLPVRRKHPGRRIARLVFVLALEAAAAFALVTAIGGSSPAPADAGEAPPPVPAEAVATNPANFRAGPGHNWANAIAMATPIAHKGTIAGAKVQAMTVLDLVLRPEVVQSAKDYFNNVQLKQRKYTPLLREGDTPAIHLNKDIMDRYRPEMRKYYFDKTKYKTYLDQMKDMLGYSYPTVRTATSSGQ